MDEAERFHRALCEVFETLVTAFDGGAVQRRNGYLLSLCPALPLPQFNGVWADTDEASADQLGGVIAEVEEQGLPFSLQTRAGRTPRVEKEAERLGLSFIDAMPAMFASEGALAGADVPDLAIERLDAGDQSELTTALEVAAGGFQAPAELLAPMYATDLVSRLGWSLYVGRVEGEPVSTALGWVRDGLVFIGSVATPPRWTRRGYAAALTARACLDGFRAGAETAFLQSSQQAHGMYRRLGFHDVTAYRLFATPPQDPDP